MTNKQVSRGSLTVLAGILLCTVSFSPLAAQNLKQRIIQTNSAGDNIHIIDPARIVHVNGDQAARMVTSTPTAAESRQWLSINTPTARKT